ncbi:DUF4328 domain-containing protein [Thalassorhabdus alkalitolerans]|uniref:DUF4328 domain-containing protein n=1 Tax=Thalassorhabdus alkalitolerans TaxID=2282697 RepID=A0ABW0YQG6_9BACI|nr:DUF4328 domain-containing protein [Thalassobacillus sp. C254]
MKQEALHNKHSKDPGRRAKVSVIFIVLTIVFSIISIAASLIEAGIFNAYDPGTTFDQISSSDMETLGMISLFIHLPNTLIFMVSIVFYLFWLYRMHENARIMDLEGVVYTPGWGVAFYFIPLVNLVLPLISMFHLYTSHLKQKNNNQPNKGHTLIIFVWWITFISSYLASNPVNFWTEGETIEFLLNDTQNFIVSEVLFVLSGICLLIVMRRLTALQKELLAKR